MTTSTSAPAPRRPAGKPHARGTLRAIPASLTRAARHRRAARAARILLRRDLASYTSAAGLKDLDAILSRHSDEETAEIRRILTTRLSG